MSSPRPKIYWDACCFISILNDEDFADTCLAVLKEAQVGDIELHISSLTMGEVVRPKGQPKPLPRNVRDTVLAFFENDYVRLINLDRAIVRKSLDYCWDYNLKPRDALHLAAADAARCDFLETLDPDLLKLGSVDDVQIRRPVGKGQADLL